jgi:tetratricopeptide (TPR) repeat protein
VYTREQVLEHLNYIRKLWNSVKDLEAKGKTLQEIQDQLSLEKDFAFVKETTVYKNTSEDWIQPQHDMHIRFFYLQGKKLASEIIKEAGRDSLEATIRKLKSLGKEVYFDEISLDRIGFEWMNNRRANEALEIYKLIVEEFPRSFSAYDSLGSAFMENGDIDNAIKNFKKSLQLNPNNAYAAEMLKKLDIK